MLHVVPEFVVVHHKASWEDYFQNFVVVHHKASFRRIILKQGIRGNPYKILLGWSWGMPGGPARWPSPGGPARGAQPGGTQLKNGLNAGIWPTSMLDRDLDEIHITSSHDLFELDLALTFHICF